jgi:hypothetical protein
MRVLPTAARSAAFSTSSAWASVRDLWPRWVWWVQVDRDLTGPPSPPASLPLHGSGLSGLPGPAAWPPRWYGAAVLVVVGAEALA